jgi:3-hydroxyacyl-[acyl-carrier-protein] dehydratase
MTSPAKSPGKAEKPAAVYEIADILRILPHRFPFLLVDRVLKLERDLKAKNRVGWKITALKNATFNEPFFSGHFPHRPVMPGVLQIEAMAQAGCLAVVDPNGPEMDVAIAGINNARFRRPVVPGDQLILTAEITKDRGQIMMLRCELHVDGELASEAEMIAKVFPKGS